MKKHILSLILIITMLCSSISGFAAGMVSADLIINGNMELLGTTYLYWQGASSTDAVSTDIVYSGNRALKMASTTNENLVVFLGGQSYCLFPWLGTRSFRTLRRFLQKYASELGISDIQSESCHYIKFKAREDAAKSFCPAAQRFTACMTISLQEKQLMTLSPSKKARD
mgnify:CR=1 FL=1